MSQKPFRKNDDGSIVPAFALALIPLIGMFGAAVDYSRAAAERAKLQARVDGAAIHAAEAGLSPEEATKRVSLTFADDAANGTTVKTSVTGGSVTVSARKQMKTAVMAAAGFEEMGIVVKSTAARETKGPPICILGLNRTASSSVSFAGNTSFKAKGCAVYSNSSASDGLAIQGSATAEAEAFCSAGGASGVFNPQAATSCPVRKDPYEKLAAPSSSGCDYPNKNDASVNPNNTKNFKPGIYCETLDIKGTANFASGTYVLKKGMNINAQGSAIGTAVTFYLTGSDATLTINGGGNINLSAPTEEKDSYKGLLFIQDRAVSAGATSKLNGNSETVLMGAIYLPTQKLEITGTGGFGSKSPFMPIIADRISFSGNSTVETDLTKMSPAQPLPTMSSPAHVSN